MKRRKRGEGVRGAGWYLVAQQPNQGPPALLKQAPLELCIVLIKRRSAQITVNRTGPDHAHIRADFLKLAKRVCARRRTDLLVNLPTDNYQADTRAATNRRRHMRRVRHNGEVKIMGKTIRNGYIRRTGIQKQHAMRLNHRHHFRGEFALSLNIALKPLNQRNVMRMNWQGAAIYANTLARSRQITQVTPDRIFGNVKLVREINRNNFARRLKPLKDFGVALREEEVSRQ
jgi:hypothetical protein